MQQVPLLKSLVWPERDSNPQPPDRAADALTTRPQERFFHMVNMVISYRSASIAMFSKLTWNVYETNNVKYTYVNIMAPDENIDDAMFQ